MANPMRMGETTDRVLKALTRQDVWEKYYTMEYTFPEHGGDAPIKYRISIVTNCMGRLPSIEQTYLKNIEDNVDYGNIEFVLLNYNSKDDLDIWAFSNLLPYIRKGIVQYYKTTEPVYYSMTHSRNICYKLASGDIVTNVDADQFTNQGFAERLNQIANQYDTDKVVFVKSRQTNRGRIGLYKSVFCDLGGYDEGLDGYGFDDQDLLIRAYHSGCKIVPFGGQYAGLVPKHIRHQGGNYRIQDWKYTMRRNTLISLLNIYMERYKANEGHHCGKAHLIHNFSEEINI